MAERPTTFSGKDAKRIAQVVRRVEQQPRLDLSGKALQGVVRDPIQNWVQVTSLTPTSGRLPGKWYQYDASAASWTVQALDIWVVDANAVTLTVGTRYRGYAAGDANGRLVFLVSESAASGGDAAAWTSKVTVGYASLSTAGTSNTAALYTLPAAGIIHGVIYNVTQAFAAPGLTQADLELYNATAAAVFTNSYTPADGTATGIQYRDHLDQAYLGGDFSYFSSGATRNISLQFTSNVALNTLTAGSVDVWLLVSTLP